MGTRGYKAFDKDLRCRDMQYAVGGTYTVPGPLKICAQGLHFCERLLDVYEFYPKGGSTRICEVEALGEVLKEDTKSATLELKILREVLPSELLDAVFKQRNSGDGNSGDWNSGYGNSGNRNSGDWNSGDGNSGYFNLSSPVYFFNKPSKVKVTAELANKLRSINVKPILTWIPSDQMTDAEQTAHPSHKTTGGFLRSTGRHDFRYLTEADKQFIRSLPNFNDKIFQVISGGVSLIEKKPKKKKGKKA